MELNTLKRIYFLGIGGIGMSALARYFKSMGVEVSGYDKTQTPLTEELVSEGIPVVYEEDPQLIPAGIELVIHTPAVPVTHAGYGHFVKLGIPIKKRAEILGMLTRGLFTVAVAGTHGKTSISCMTAHLLRSAAYPANAFVGGISVNTGTNLMLDPAARLVVTEADEFDRSFLQLEPDIAVISAMDADHLDIYGNHAEMKRTFLEFVGKIRPGGLLICHEKLRREMPAGLRMITYGIGAGDVRADGIRVEEGHFGFDLRAPGQPETRMIAGVPGRHNIENALAALAIGMELGMGVDVMAAAVKTFRGVKRRFEIHVESEDLRYVDDYAHHPEEIRACIGTARELWPGARITAIFQPHLFTRTRDLAADFALALDLADELILLPIYPAREAPIPGVDSQMLMAQSNLKHKQLVEKSELPRLMQGRSSGTILTMGAGDIDQWVGPIRETLIAQLKAGGQP